MLRRGAVGRRGPGLIGTVARTAVVAGTATATVNAVNTRRGRHQQEAADEQAQQQAAQQQPAQQESVGEPAVPANAPEDADLATKLKQLADLNAAGALSSAEFAAAKAKLLGM
jgi:hemolysin activation/secretion protein